MFFHLKPGCVVARLAWSLSDANSVKFITMVLELALNSNGEADVVEYIYHKF